MSGKYMRIQTSMEEDHADNKFTEINTYRMVETKVASKPFYEFDFCNALVQNLVSTLATCYSNNQIIQCCSKSFNMDPSYSAPTI